MDLELVQMDVKTTFLHKELDEVIFMDQSEGFVKVMSAKFAVSSGLFMD